MQFLNYLAVRRMLNIHLIDSWECSCPLIDVHCMVCDKEFDMISILECIRT